MNYKITKIGENTVEVRKTKKILDINGIEFNTYDEPDYYGKDRLEEEMRNAQEELSVAMNFDAEAYKQELITKAEEKVNFLAQIEQELNRQL